MNYALHEALRLVREEGLESRFQRHLDHARLLWDGLQEQGLELHVPQEHRVPSLTTVKVPDGIHEPEYGENY